MDVSGDDHREEASRYEADHVFGIARELISWQSIALTIPLGLIMKHRGKESTLLPLSVLG